MNKTNMLKVLLVIMITVGLISMTTQVFADGMLDLSNTLQGGTTNQNTTNSNLIDTNTTTGNGTNNTNTNANNLTTNSIGNSTTNTSGNLAANSVTNKNTNSNSSLYAESDIPHAGIETSVLTIAAFISCAIIGIYTFTKLSDYSNI